MSSKPGHVYLFHALTTEKYKIGITTRTVEERLKEINGKQAADEIVCVHSIWVSDCRSVESELHAFWESHHRRNEWFLFPTSDIKRVIASMDSYKANSRKPQRISSPSTANSKDSASDSDAIAALSIVAAIAALWFFVLPQASQVNWNCIRKSGVQACQKAHPPSQRKPTKKPSALQDFNRNFPVVTNSKPKH